MSEEIKLNNELNDTCQECQSTLHQQIHLFEVTGMCGPVAEAGSFHLVAPGSIPVLSAQRFHWGCMVVVEFIRCSRP